MPSGLHLISPHAPPAGGGVADHTANLARRLAETRPVRLVTMPGQGAGLPGVTVREFGSWNDPAALLQAVAEPGDWPVLWQYVPHMYGRGGVNPAVPEAMERLRRAGRRQVVLAHEIAAPFSLWPQRSWYAWQHRRQWKRICHAVEAIGFSTEAWLAEARNLDPDRAAGWFLSPSPSNIPVVPSEAGFRKAFLTRHALPENSRLLLWFGTLSKAKQFDWMIAAWRAAQCSESPVVLVTLGGSPKAPLSDDGRLFLPLGFQSEDEVSRLLQVADMVGLPFVDGVSERRTSFMAALSHACPVVTTLGHNTGKSLRAAKGFVAVTSDDLDGFVRASTELLNAPEQRHILGEAGHRLYLDQFGWPVVLQRVRMALGEPCR